MSAAAPPTAKRRRASPAAHPIFVASGTSSDEGEGEGRPSRDHGLSLGNVVVLSPGRAGSVDTSDSGGGARRRRRVGEASAGAATTTVAPPPTHPFSGGGSRPRPIGGGSADKGPDVMEGGKANGSSQWVASGGATGAFPPDPRVTLLFDLNGVLLVNPRSAAGARVPALRPHTGPALARLAGAFRLGVYSSATAPTVMKALAPVAAAVREWNGGGAGVGAGGGGGAGGSAATAAAAPKLFELVLCRKFCRPAPESHVAAGGKVWDTVKPLAMHFGGPESLGRVVLVDNDAHKALPDEAGNMLLVPTWDGPPGMMSAGAAGPHPPPPDPDRVLLHLADTLLDPVAGLAGEAVGDVRDRTAGVAARVAAASAADEAAAAATAATLPVPPQTRVRAQAVPAPAGPARALPDPSNGLSGGATAAFTPGVATPGTPGGLPDERAAWATAVAAAVAELGATGSAPLASIIAYARFRAPGAAVQAFLTKRAVKEAVAALARGGRLVAAALPADAKVVAGKHLKACYGLAPGTALPEGGVAAAVDALRSLVAGVKPPASASPPRKKNKGSKAGTCGGGTGSVESVRAQHGAVRAAIDTVVLASVADLTANGRAPNMATILKHMQDAYGRPTFANAAGARSQLLSRLEEDLRVKVVSFGPRTPPTVAGLRCLAAPTGAEVDTALMMLLEYKRRAKQPSLPITGTLASDDEGGGSGDDLSVGQFNNNIVAFPVLVPAEAALAPPAAPIELDAPLPVYEDRGGVAAGPPAPHGGEMGAPIAAPAHAPHSVSARGDPAPGALAPHLAAAHAPPTLAGRPLGANWWEGGGGDERALNPAGSPPPPPPPVVPGPLPGPAFTDLHHEVVAFAHRASPSPAEAHTVQDAVSAIRRLATGLWPASRTILFGSQATGLALPGSDLDIVILGASDELENPASGFSWDQRHALGDRLRALLKAMRKANLVAGKAVVIKARVPIIKCDLRSGVAVDVSLGAANGAAAVRFIHKQVSLVPALRPLILVVKAVLKEAGLNEVFSGGLSSYSTTLMVMAHLQAEGVAPPPTAAEEDGDPAAAAAAPLPPLTHDCGRLLWSFFHRFGRRFDYAREAVRVNAGGVAPKPAAWAKPERPFALAVEDPQEEGKDIGSGSYNIAAVQVCFRRAADKLAAVVGGGGGGGGVAGPGPGAAAGGGPRRGGAPIEFRAGGSGRWAPQPEDEAAAWATIQADSASRGAASPPPFHQYHHRPPTPLNQIMDVEAAAARPALGGGSGRALPGAAAGGGGRGPPWPAPPGGRAAAARAAALHHTRGPPPPAHHRGGRDGDGRGGLRGGQPLHRKSLANQVAAATTPGPLYGGGGGRGGGGGGGKWAKARAAKHAAAAAGGVHKPPPRKGRR